MCYLDRSNLAYAALQLNDRLGFSEAVYGTGASLFFLGYVACQLPSNAVLLWLGPRTWLPTLVLAWGCVACAFAAMTTPAHFYCLRIALGVAEAGVFPALWVVMARFFGERDLGLAYTLASLGTSAAQVAGGPLAAGLLALDGVVAGLAGWQLLFLVEGAPTLALGAWLATCLPDSPAAAAFLTPDERAYVAAREAREAAAKAGGGPPAGPATPGTTRAGLVAAARDPRTWAVAGVAALENAAKNGLMYWCPLIIAGLVSNGEGEEGGDAGVAAAAAATAGAGRPVSLSAVAGGRRLLSGGAAALVHPPPGANPSLVALLSALPFAASAAAMWACAAHSRKAGERRAHIAGPYVAAAAALAGLALSVEARPATAFACLLGSAALWAPSGVLHTLPASFLAGPAAAAGIALINSLSNVGGLVGPAALGALRAATGSHAAGLGALAAAVAAAAVLAWTILPDPPMPGVGGGAGGGGVVRLAASAATASADEEAAAPTAAAAVAMGGGGAVARRRG